MKDELFSIIGIVAVGAIFIFLIAKSLKFHLTMVENFTGSSKATAKSPQSATNGEAGNASNYNATIKSTTVQMQDELLISKYRADYENILIGLDDYVSMLQLKNILNINPDINSFNANMDTIKAINELQITKQALNDAMKYIDKQ